MNKRISLKNKTYKTLLINPQILKSQLKQYALSKRSKKLQKLINQVLTFFSH
jgi:hypothetical protein